MNINRLLILFFIVFISKHSSAQDKPVHFTKLNHGYTFNLIGSWKEADKATLQEKIKIDRSASGKDLNYDYVFSESSSNITVPFIVVSPLFAGRNYFEDFKKSYVAKFDPTVIKFADTLSKAFNEIKFNENSTTIDEKNKSITSIVKVLNNENVEMTSLTYICFNNKYTIQFIFCSNTKDFPLFYATYFDKIINSIKTFNIK